MKFAKSVSGHRVVSHGGPYSVKRRDSTIVDFSSNVNPLGCPNVVKKMLKTMAGTIPVYPDPDSTDLKKVLARHLHTETENLVVGNGATEIIYNFCRAVVGRDAKVLIPSPTFGEYEAAVRLSGGRPTFFKTMRLQNDVDGFIARIPKNGVVFVCNPNNPTGEIVPKNTMMRILRAAQKRGAFVFVDECFIELTAAPEQSVVDEVPQFKNLFVLRSLTKSFGLAGLRIGYGVGSKKLVSILNRIKIPWNVSGIAQKAAILALSDREFLPRTRKMIARESQFLRDSISQIGGFSCFDSDTNFILVKSGTRSKELQQKLLQKGILIRDCSTFRGLDRSYVRIAVKTRNENALLVKRLRSVR